MAAPAQARQPPQKALWIWFVMALAVVGVTQVDAPSQILTVVLGDFRGEVVYFSLKAERRDAGVTTQALTV